MTVSDATTVDAVGIENTTGDFVLTIFDHLEWAEDGHLKLVQEKLNLYLAFCEGGEIYDIYPGSVDRFIRLSIRAKHSPDETARQYFEAAKKWFRMQAMNWKFWCDE